MRPSPVSTSPRTTINCLPRCDSAREPRTRKELREGMWMHLCLGSRSRGQTLRHAGSPSKTSLATGERRDYTVRRSLSLSPRSRAPRPRTESPRREARNYSCRSSRNALDLFHGSSAEEQRSKSVRLRRHTIHVCAPGVSMSTC